MVWCHLKPIKSLVVGGEWSRSRAGFLNCELDLLDLTWTRPRPDLDLCLTIFLHSHPPRSGWRDSWWWQGCQRWNHFGHPPPPGQNWDEPPFWSTQTNRRQTHPGDYKDTGWNRVLSNSYSPCSVVHSQTHWRCWLTHQPQTVPFCG